MMNIALSEIWNFLSIVDQKEQGWSYTLHAGAVAIKGIDTEVMHHLKKDQAYDTELLPALFTFREILWQPDVFTDASMSLPPLRILKAFCADTVVELMDKEDLTSPIYVSLIKGLGKCTSKTIKSLEKEGPNVQKELGRLRTCAFPIIKFFINHPKNRKDYQMDALNRLNYAVKIMLTEFYGRYSDLAEPYWQISYRNSADLSKSQMTKQEQ